jgi:hypothetical protein
VCRTVSGSGVHDLGGVAKGIECWGVVQGVSAWNFDVAALKEQAQREGGLEPSLAPIIEGATSDMSAQTGSGSGEQGDLLLIDH